MRGMFWNSRGLSDLAKHKHVSDCVREHGLDFVAISEAGKCDFRPHVLDHLSGGFDYAWHSLPARGRSGGILLGIMTTTMDLLAFSIGEFHIKFHLRNRADNFTWTLVAVYGAAQDEHKSAFLRELVNLAKNNPYPMLIGGDFNILRYQEEKNNDRFDTHWPFLFNAVIDSLDLREASMSGRQFTWANNRSVPTYEKLDRVLMDTEWELKFPLVTVRALERIEALSDHAPIILDSNSTNPATRRPFKFELGWLNRDGFVDMIKNVWERPAVGRTPIQRWIFKIRAMRRHLSGWAKHTNGIYKKEKQRLCTIIDDLDKIAETRTLSQQEIELKNQSNEMVARLLREEEIKYYQRSKADFILMGDSNTRYFQLLANGRHRKKCIHSLQQDEGRIEGQRELKNYHQLLQISVRSVG